MDRLIGFQDLGGKDDFTAKALEALLIKKGSASTIFLFLSYCKESFLNVVFYRHD